MEHRIEQRRCAQVRGIELENIELGEETGARYRDQPRSVVQGAWRSRGECRDERPTRQRYQSICLVPNGPRNGRVARRTLLVEPLERVRDDP